MKPLISPMIQDILKKGDFTCQEVHDHLNGQFDITQVRNCLQNLYIRGKVSKRYDNESHIGIYGSLTKSQPSLVEEFNNLLAAVRGWKVVL